MQNLNRLPLSGLRAIEAVARCGTVAQAALELGVTSSALSQRVNNLERTVGQTLFERAPTGMVPTQMLKTIMPDLTRIFGELNAVAGALKPDANCTLTVSVAPIFASRWLVWRLMDFSAQHPHIAVRIEPNFKLVHPDYSDVDMCIRVGNGGWDDVEKQELIPQRVFPVCAADLAAKIKTIDDLSHVPIIRENSNLYGWPEWLGAQGANLDVLKNGPTYGDSSLCFDAALAGQGIFMAWETLASDALKNSKIVEPFGYRHQMPASYWIVTGRKPKNQRAVAAFSEWLSSALKEALF